MYRRIYVIFAVYDCPKQLHIVKGMSHRQTSRVKGYDFKDFILMWVQKMTDPAKAGGKKYCRDEESLTLRVRSPTTPPHEGPSVTDPSIRRRAALKIPRNG
jgi:hypothetical protein